MNGKQLRYGESALIWTMCFINVCMLIFFVSKTGIKQYVLITGLMVWGWTGGVYVGFKKGIMFGRRQAITRDESPIVFYVNIGILTFLYLLVVLIFFGIFLQKIGYLVQS